MRRNSIANLLAEWGLVVLLDKSKTEKSAPISQIKIISHKEKDEWELEPKYNIGKKRTQQ